VRRFPLTADKYCAEKSIFRKYRLGRGTNSGAIIDPKIDASHPTCRSTHRQFRWPPMTMRGTPHRHGTGMAGAIAAPTATLLRYGHRGGDAIGARNSARGKKSGRLPTFNSIKGSAIGSKPRRNASSTELAGPALIPPCAMRWPRRTIRAMVTIAAAGNAAGPNFRRYFRPRSSVSTRRDRRPTRMMGCSKGRTAANSRCRPHRA